MKMENTLKRSLLLILFTATLAPAMEREQGEQPIKHNVPSLKFLTAHKLGQNHSEASIDELPLPTDLKNYAKFMADQKHRLQDDLSPEYHDENEMINHLHLIDTPLSPRSRKIIAQDHAQDAQHMLSDACFAGILDEQLLNDLYAINPNLDLNKGPMTPLIIASQYGFLDIMNLLLDKGANINLQPMYGTTAAHNVAGQHTPKEHHTHALALLCQRGANINLTDEKYGCTPLMRACEVGKSAEMVNLLIQHGAHIDQAVDGNTALMHATRAYRNPLIRQGIIYDDGCPALQALLKHKPNLELLDNQGRTAFVIATKNIPAMRLLKNAGANINYRPPALNYHEAALIDAVKSDEVNSTFTLLQMGANVEITDRNSETALVIATKHSKLPLVKLLLKYNPNIHAQDFFHSTSIMIALQNKNFEITQLLLDHTDQIPFTHPSQWYHGLSNLVKTNNTQLLKALLDKGVYESLESRLASFILKTEKDGIFSYNLTECAELLCTSYRHLLRIINLFCSTNKLVKNGKFYKIIDRSYLEKVSSNSLIT